MLQQERHNHILAKLNLEGKVRVKDLSKEFGVTEDCIRKDLKILEKAGKLKRIHGGAMQQRVNLHAINVNERLGVHLAEKKAIALKAVDLIEPQTVLFLGISTVNLEIARLIYERNLNIIVVTNMIDIMKIFSEECVTQVIFIGGSFNRARDGFIGSITIDQIHQYRFDLSFLGVVGIDVHEGKVTTYDVNDGLTKKAVLHSSKKSYMVAESAKLHLDGNYTFADMSDFSGYICEGGLDENIEKKILSYGLEII